MPFYYQAYGLSICSDIELPGLLTLDPTEQFDVTIEHASIDNVDDHNASGLGGLEPEIPKRGCDRCVLRGEHQLGVDFAGVDEIILAMNPNIEGEATAMYLARLLEPLGIAVTKIASGLPVGGDLEYADELTLSKALEGRQRLGGAPTPQPE